MSFLIEHTLDFQHSFDIPLNIEALVPSALFRFQKSELRFPETEHIRGKLRQLTHFADFIEDFAPQSGFSSHDRPHGAVDDVGEADLRIDVLLKHLARPKRNDSTGGNSNFFSSSRISSFTGSLAADNKVSKPRDFDRFSLLQDRLQQIQYKLDDISGFIFRETDLLENLLSDIRLSHATPLRDHCNSPRFCPKTSLVMR
jgi:hypothetical protein